jgi:NADPH2:quinone reductase
MRAALVPAWGPPEQVLVTDVAEPQPRPGHVIVGVAAAALNFPDLLLIANEYQISVPAPFVLGSEFAGTVLSVASDVQDVRVGQRVSGALLTGAFAEQVSVPTADVAPVPDELDFGDAAAFGVCYRTAFHALVTAGEVQPGTDVVVLGAAGGVGSAAVDLAVAMGARVIAVTSGPRRREFLEARGAHVVLDRTEGDLRGQLKRASVTGADVVVDPIGGESSEAALRSLRWGGRFVVVGFASGEIPRIPLNLVLLKGVRIVAVELRTLGQHLPWAVERADTELAALVAGGLRPAVGSSYDLADVVTALQDMRAGRIMGKCVLRVVAG